MQITSEKVKPINPKQVLELKKNILPSEVIESFNHLIAKNFLNGQSIVKKEEAIAMIMSKLPDLRRIEIYDNNYLDIEEIYMENGWDVYYDGPSYNENYEASYKFVPK